MCGSTMAVLVIDGDHSEDTKGVVKREGGMISQCKYAIDSPFVLDQVVLVGLHGEVLDRPAKTPALFAKNHE